MLRNSGSEIASGRDLFENVSAEDWISADREERRRGRDYCTLDYTWSFDYVHSARLPACRELKGGLQEHAGL